MTEVSAAVLSMSVTGAALILILLLLTKIMGGRTSRSWQYYIWLLVVARLLIPFGPDLAVTERTFHALSDAADVLAAESAWAAEDANAKYSPGAWNESGDEKTDTAPAVRDDAQRVVSKQMGTLTAAAIAGSIWVIWAIGVAVMLVRRVTAYQSFHKYVRAGLEPCEDTKILDAVAAAGQKCRVRRPIEVGINRLVSSPQLIGLVHPCIVLPKTDMSSEEVGFIAMHEMVHLRRLDIVYKWLVQIAVCVHWFNPLVYVMAKRTAKECEFACDEAVVRMCGPESAVPYGMTLLNAMASVGVYDEPGSAVGLSENKQILKERLSAMKTYGSVRKGAAAVAAILTVCILVLTACSGVYRGYVRPAPQRTSAGMQTQDSIELTRTDGSAAQRNLQLDIRSSNVVLGVSGSDGEINAEYNHDFYDVEMTEQGSDVRLTCRSRRSNLGSERVHLFVPEETFAKASCRMRNSLLEWNLIPMDVIEAEADSSALLFNVPGDFSGTLDADVKTSYAELCSESDFAGMSVELQGPYVAAPAYFSRTGTDWSYDDGTRARISVRSDGSSALRAVDNQNTTLGTLAERAGILSEDTAFDLQEAGEWIGTVLGAAAEKAAERFEAKAEEAADRLEERADQIADAAEAKWFGYEGSPAPTAESTSSGRGRRAGDMADGASAQSSAPSASTAEPSQTPENYGRQSRDGSASFRGALYEFGMDLSSFVGDILSMIGDVLRTTGEEVQGAISQAGGY